MSAFYPHTAYWPRSNRGVERWRNSAAEDQSDQQPDEQQSSCHRAIAAKDWQLVQQLINQPNFDPEVRDEQGFTPLLRLCQTGPLSLLAELLSVGASPLSCNRAGANALLLAAYHGNMALLSLLLSHPAAQPCTEQQLRSASLLAARGWLQEDDQEDERDDGMVGGEQEQAAEGGRRRRSSEQAVRRAVRAAIHRFWCRRLAAAVYEAVQCLPMDLALLIAEMAVGVDSAG